RVNSILLHFNDLAQRISVRTKDDAEAHLLEEIIRKVLRLGTLERAQYGRQLELGGGVFLRPEINRDNEPSVFVISLERLVTVRTSRDRQKIVRIRRVEEKKKGKVIEKFSAGRPPTHNHPNFLSSITTNKSYAQ